MKNKARFWLNQNIVLINIKDVFMDVKEFLNKSYTAYHAVKYGAEMLEKAGFKKLDMKDV